MPDLSVFILAGGLNRCNISVSTGRAVPRLPLASSTSLVDAWCRSLDRSLGGFDSFNLASVTVISSHDPGPGPAATCERSIAGLRYVRDSRLNRGTAGVVADQILKDAGRTDGMVLVLEASSSPAVDMRPVLARKFDVLAGSQACVLGVSELGRYCGVCLCDRESFSLVPDVGFCDFKEQFLPLLRSAGRVIESATIAPRAWRLRSRTEWLAIVEAWARRAFDDCEEGTVCFESTLPTGHREDGVCVIEPGALTHGAVIASSIIMTGAVVESGAVVARSVIGPGAVIAAGSVVVDAVVPARAKIDSHRMRMSHPSSLRFPRSIPTMEAG